jgi:hypothetical protein
MKRVLIPALFAALLVGCSAPRWQIHTTSYTYHSSETPKDEFSSSDTILIDTQTGRTWIMSPAATNDTADWYWIEVQKKQ